MMEQLPTPFYVKDCTLVAISTGLKAQNLGELRDKIAIIPQGSIYYHFWGGRLRTAFEYKEYQNDFASWAHHSLHDEVLSERLELIDPTEYSSTEDLRMTVIELIENRLDEIDDGPGLRGDEQFYFIRSKIIAFDTRYQIDQPSDLVKIIPLLTHSSLFYHFIDTARRPPEHIDDFSLWLEGFNKYQDLIDELRKIDPYFLSLADLQQKLTEVFTNYFIRQFASGEK